MDPSELQARAIIAAALITSHAVELPTMPSGGDWTHDASALRLRELTNYVYQIIAVPGAR
jgi:hypothetical protein